MTLVYYDISSLIDPIPTSLHILMSDWFADLIISLHHCKNEIVVEDRISSARTIYITNEYSFEITIAFLVLADYYYDNYLFNQLEKIYVL